MFIDFENKILDEIHNQEFLDEDYINANSKFWALFDNLSFELQNELLEVRNAFENFNHKREMEIISRSRSFN